MSLLFFLFFECVPGYRVPGYLYPGTRISGESVQRSVPGSVQVGQIGIANAPEHLQKCNQDQNRAIGIRFKRLEKSLGR